MAPPEAPKVGITAAQGDQPPAVPLRLQSPALKVLRKRSDFLRAARAAHAAMPGFVLQMRKRGADEDGDAIRVGFTCSKKVGNAVARNRAKRRLREAARLILPSEGRAGTDYVLIGRKDKTANLPFEKLQSDLRHAVQKLNRSTS